MGRGDAISAPLRRALYGPSRGLKWMATRAKRPRPEPGGGVLPQSAQADFVIFHSGFQPPGAGPALRLTPHPLDDAALPLAEEERVRRKAWSSFPSTLSRMHATSILERTN